MSGAGALGHEGEVDYGLTRDGVVQLRRRWRATTDGGAPHAAMLLLHGISEHSGRYGPEASQLAAAGIEVVAIDHRGFGGSGGRRAYVRSFDEYVTDAVDQLAEVRRLGLPTVLFGHSMGGLIALLAVLQRRDPRPDLLVLSAPALDAGVPRILRRVAAVAARLAPTVPVPVPIDASVLSNDPQVVAAFRSDTMVVRTVTPMLGRELFAAIDWANDHLDELDVPTLVLHGDEDRLVPTICTEPLESVRCVERRLLAGVRHEPHHEPSYVTWAKDLAAWICRSITAPHHPL